MMAVVRSIMRPASLALAVVVFLSSEALTVPSAGCGTSTGVFYSQQVYDEGLDDWVDVHHTLTDVSTGLTSAYSESGTDEYHYLAKAQATAPLGLNPAPSVKTYVTASSPTGGPDNVCYGQAKSVVYWQPVSGTLAAGSPIVSVFDMSMDGMLRSGGWAAGDTCPARIAVWLNVYDRASGDSLASLRGDASLARVWDELAEEYVYLFDDNDCLDGLFTWPDIPDMEYPEDGPEHYIARLHGATIPLSFNAVVGGEYVIEAMLRSEIGTGSLSETTSLSDFFNTCSYGFQAAYAPTDILMQSPLDVTMNVTPEPATMGLLSLGGLAVLRRRRVA